MNKYCQKIKKHFLLLLLLFTACTMAQQIKTDSTKGVNQCQPTFLDTLNKGKELVLTPQDFNRPQKSTVSASDTSGINITYQVQFFTTAKLKSAEKEKKDIEESLQVPVSIIEESAVYKLRAGKFKKKEDAEKLRKQIIEIGHKDAWIYQNKETQ